MLASAISLVRSKAGFVQQFIRNPRKVGSITPSSIALCETMASAANWQDVRRVAELGAGDGVLTKVLLKHMSADAEIDVFEISPPLVRTLRMINDPRVSVHAKSAERLYGQYDVIFPACHFCRWTHRCVMPFFPPSIKRWHPVVCLCSFNTLHLLSQNFHGTLPGNASGYLKTSHRPGFIAAPITGHNDSHLIWLRTVPHYPEPVPAVTAVQYFPVRPAAHWLVQTTLHTSPELLHESVLPGCGRMGYVHWLPPSPETRHTTEADILQIT